MIRPIVLALGAACLANLSPICRAAYAAQQEAEVVDGVAAVVNGEVVTYSQVRQVVGPREKLLRSQFQGEELVQKVKEARQAALSDLIDRQLIFRPSGKNNSRFRTITLKSALTRLSGKTLVATATPSSKPSRRKIIPKANSRRWRWKKSSSRRCEAKT